MMEQSTMRELAIRLKEEAVKKFDSKKIVSYLSKVFSLS